MWRRNQRIQQKNPSCLQSQRWRRSRNHRFIRRNQTIRRRNQKQRNSIRNLRQKRSILKRSQSTRRSRLQKQTRKRRTSHRSLRTHHWKITNHRSQHQRRKPRISRIKQIRSLQPHHGLSSSCLHLLPRIPRQRCTKNGRLESLYRSLHWRRQKERIRSFSRIQSLISWNHQNQKRRSLSQSWCRNQIETNRSCLENPRKDPRISRCRITPS